MAVLNSGDAFGDTVWRRPLSISPAKCSVYIRALSFADIHVIKRSALKKVLGFYTDYALSFDKELRLAINICEVYTFRKLKRKRKLQSQEVQTGITRLLGHLHQ